MHGEIKWDGFRIPGGDARTAITLKPVSNWTSSRLKHLTGLDRAIGFSFLARGWAAGAGIITVLLIAHFLTPQEQGYYYTFSNLVALQLIFDLGFSFVILQLAAHERARLSLSSAGQIQGDKSLTRYWRPFSNKQFAGIQLWRHSWPSSCSPRASTFSQRTGPEAARFVGSRRGPLRGCILPHLLDGSHLSFLEGCGEISHVARLRLTQAIAGSLLGWLALVTHRGLYAAALVIMGQAGSGVQFLGGYCFARKSSIRRHPTALLPKPWLRQIKS